MTESMVEKVARALCRPVYQKVHPLQPSEVIDQYVDINWPNHVDQARAAIEALAVPTDAQMNAGFEQQEADDHPGLIYRATIQAALTEGTGE